MNPILLILFLFVFTSCGQIKTTNEDESKTHSDNQNEIAISLNNAVKTVFYKLSPTPTMNEYTNFQEKIRSFIWEHWKLKKQVTLKTEAYSKEGERTINTYEIKCAENRNCKLFVKSESENAGRGTPRQKILIDVHEYIAESVNRIELPKDYFVKRKIIDEAKDVSAENFWLQFRDEKGKVITEF